jgi:serine/threonine protein kinase
MGLLQGHFFKRTLARLFLHGSKDNRKITTGQSDQDFIDMSSPELETSGLQEKSTIINVPILPDETAQVQMGSGVTNGILGEGGAAIIYEIRNKQLGLQRAVKLLKPHYTRDTYNRFLREFRISIQLNHPNIAVVHTIGQWNKLPFIEMEKISGFSLSKIVAQFGPLPTGLVSAIGIILCKTLSYLHTCAFELDKKTYHGLLHLDLKPSNILLSDSGVLKVMDFGLATPIEEGQRGLYPDGVGSLQYIAPELLLGQGAPDVRSDIYSLGCILYELLSGVKTFPGPEEKSVMELRQTNTYISLKKLSKAIHPEMLALIEECLSLKKEKRPLNIEEIRKSLELIHQSSTRLSPENTIQLYVTQRRINEPFMLPQPAPTTGAILRTAGIIAGAVVILIIILMQQLQGNFPEFKKISTSITKPINKEQPKVPAQSPQTLQPEETDFYATDVNSTQAALLDSMRIAWATRKFDVMISIIDRLQPELAQSKEVLLYKLRALGRGGEELGKILDETELSDAEYFFHKARYQFGNKEYANALENLDKALSLPCEFLDKRILGREVQLYKSRCLTSIFRADPTSEKLQAAIEAWNLLLELVNDNPNGILGKEAQKEKQNLFAEASWRGIS